MTGARSPGKSRFTTLLKRPLTIGLAVAAVLFAVVNILALSVPPLVAAPARSPLLIIDGVAIVDPDSGGRVSQAQTVEVENDRIAYVGPARDGTTQVPARRIDGRGKFLIPGLWDAHVHTLRLAPQLQFPLLIANGVTSVRDMGDTCSWSTDLACSSPNRVWQQAIASGLMVGPRMPQVITFHLEDVPSDGLALRSLLLALRTRGEPFVKLQLDPMVASDVAETVLRVADSLGLRVGGHLPFTLDLATSRVPFVSVEHDWTLLPQCSRARASFDDRTDSKPGLLAGWDDARCDAVLLSLRTRGTAYVPTHVASTGQDVAFSVGPPASANTARYIVAPQRLAWSIVRAAGKVSESEQRVLREYHAASLRLTKRAHDAGVIVLAGSDAIDPEVVHGFSLHEELQYLVRAGLSPAQALAAATTVPARFTGAAGAGGLIAAGQRADLVLLDANPLVDIRNTTRINGVLADGRWFSAAERAVLLRFVETQAHRSMIASRFLRGLWYGE